MLLETEDFKYQPSRRPQNGRSNRKKTL